MSVETSVASLIADLSKRDAAIESSPEAALALEMASRIDDSGNSATSASMCAARLLDTIGALRALAPAEERRDGVDEVAGRRNARIASA